MNIKKTYKFMSDCALTDVNLRLIVY